MVNWEREKKTGCTSVVHSNGGGLDFYQCILGIMFHNFSCMLHSNWEFQKKKKKGLLWRIRKKWGRLGRAYRDIWWPFSEPTQQVWVLILLHLVLSFKWSWEIEIVTRLRQERGGIQLQLGREDGRFHGENVASVRKWGGFTLTCQQGLIYYKCIIFITHKIGTP